VLNQLTGDNNGNRQMKWYHTQFQTTRVDDDLVLYNDEADGVDNDYDYAMVSSEVSQ
jgi:hypothetical protein